MDLGLDLDVRLAQVLDVDVEAPVLVDVRPVHKSTSESGALEAMIQRLQTPRENLIHAQRQAWT